MAKVYVFLANGLEEIEAITPVDVFRRAGIEVITVSITGSEFVKSAHNIIIKADKIFAECKFDDADLLVLPGGMPGATNLNEHQGLRNILIEHNLRHKKIGAICAAPQVLGDLGLLQGKRATCYPGFECGLTSTKQKAVQNGNIITGIGLGGTIEFAHMIIKNLLGEEKAKDVLNKIQY